MDVVNSDVEKLGGSLIVSSTPGKGTELVISVPFTQSLNEALVFRLSNRWYGLQLFNIQSVVRVPYSQIEDYLTGSRPFVHDEKTYAFYYLGDLLQGERIPSSEHRRKALPVILLKIAETYIAVLVDHLLGARQIFLKSPGPQLRQVREISGVSLLPDGEIVVILDAIVLEHIVLHDRRMGIARETKKNAYRALVVDDSITVRTMTKKLLESDGYQVDTAKDGMEGLERAKALHPNVILLDIDMPRMSGYDLIAAIRLEPRLSKTPIVVLSARTGPEHVHQCKEAGANLVLAKPCKDRLLLAHLEILLGEQNEAK